MKSPFRVSRQYWFSAAHRIEGHPKCGRLHGHNYKVTVYLEAEYIDNEGMVVDYGLMDKVIKPIIDALDHRYLISMDNVDAGDPYAPTAVDRGDAKQLTLSATTAECLASMLKNQIVEAIGPYINVPFEAHIEVQETPKSTAYV